LWVMIAVVAPVSAFTRASASSTIMPVAESSAPVGSSHNSTSGFLAMALAIATRCCSPPDKLRREMVHPVFKIDQRQSIGGRHRMFGDLCDQCYILPRRQARNQIIELKDEADMIAAV
jgi:hypothetical protein